MEVPSQHGPLSCIRILSSRKTRPNDASRPSLTADPRCAGTLPQQSAAYRQDSPFPAPSYDLPLLIFELSLIQALVKVNSLDEKGNGEGRQDKDHGQS